MPRAIAEARLRIERLGDADKNRNHRQRTAALDEIRAFDGQHEISDRVLNSPPARSIVLIGGAIGVFVQDRRP